jgi:hypothetical protein
MITVLATAATILLQIPQRDDLVQLARDLGGAVSMNLTSCFPLTDLPAITRSSPVVFEGTVLSVESRLTADRTMVYTEYVFDVRRVLHVPEADAKAVDDTALGPLPFEGSVVGVPSARSPFQARLRAPGGRVQVEGLDIRFDVNDTRPFSVGQHLVIFALYHPSYRRWQVNTTGALEVRSDALAPLSRDWQAGEFKSVEEIAAALAKLAAHRK